MTEDGDGTAGKGRGKGGKGGDGRYDDVDDGLLTTYEPSEVDYDEGSTFDLERRKEKTVTGAGMRRPFKKPGAKATPKAKAAAVKPGAKATPKAKAAAVKSKKTQ